MRTIALTCLFIALVGVAAAQDAAPATLEVAEMSFGIGYDRETRSLDGEATVFPADTPTIYCRTRILGGAEPASITPVWYREGTTVAHVELAVGSPNWRTVSSKQLLPEWTGSWEVRVLDGAGNLLRTESFTVE